MPSFYYLLHNCLGVCRLKLAITDPSVGCLHISVQVSGFSHEDGSMELIQAIQVSWQLLAFGASSIVP